GDTASAISSLTQLLRDLPRLGDGYVMLGNAYLAEKNLDAAYTAFAKAGEILPSNSQVPLMMGLILVQKKNPVEARKSFERALQISPELARAMEELVNLDIFESKYTAALDRVNKMSDEKLGSTKQILLAKIYVARAQSIARKETPGTTTVKLNSPAVQPDVNL